MARMRARSVLAAVSVVLSVIIGLVLARGGGAAGGSSGARNARPVIGLSLDTLKEARWMADKDLFVKRAGELGADVQFQAANGDDTAQMNQIQTLITNRVDVLVIVPHDGTAMAAAVRAAHEAKIPVIAYDRIIRDCDLDLYLSFDNVKV